MSIEPEPEEKRKEYFKNNPDVFKLYQEILKKNNESGQSECLKAYNQIKEYAIQHTAFYRNYTVDDEFPVMTKVDFISNKEQILSDEKFDYPFHVTSTSGSTGIPFSIPQNHEKRIRTIADLKVYGEYALYPSHEKMLQLRAYNGRTLDRSVDKRENIWRYDVANLTESGVEDLISFILNWKPVIIFGYVSTMEIISNHIIRSGKKYDFSCKSVLVGAEALTDEIATKITSVFNCPVFDRYSNMEMGIYAQREYGHTNFRVNKASYYFEVLKIDSDEPAEEHEIGRLVFTDLYNHAFPMIRYDTGDLGSYCIKNGEIEIEKVYGRKRDSIYDTDGNLIDPSNISVSMWGITGILQWQFIQKDSNEYIVNLIKSGKVNEKIIEEKLYKFLGQDAQIKFIYVNEIPVLNSQKRKYIINEWKNK